MPTKKYCGAQKPPKGSVRGTAEECIANKQLRYYGMVKIDDKLKQKMNISKLKEDLEDAQFKLRDTQLLMKKVIEEAIYIEKILSSEKFSDDRKKREEKKIPDLRKRRNKLLLELEIRKKEMEELKKELENEKKMVKPSNISIERALNMLDKKSKVSKVKKIPKESDASKLKKIAKKIEVARKKKSKISPKKALRKLDKSKVPKSRKIIKKRKEKEKSPPEEFVLPEDMEQYL
jgi:hypothetical protein